MRFTISGFGGASKEGQETPTAREAEPVSAAPRKSVVQVCFPETGRSLAYYNDRFNLKAGDRTVILSFGGSLGADRINQVVADLCAWEKQQGANVLHLHATGSRGVELFDKLEKEKGFAPGENLVVTPYINNMPQLLAAADLVIARSGALTLAELEAVGRASILIPSPNVAENHQYYNALELQKAGAAVVIEEKNLTGEGLIETVQQLLAQPGKLAEMGANAKTLGNPHSLELITAKLLELVK